jgi:hypothetical protein
MLAGSQPAGGPVVALFSHCRGAIRSNKSTLGLKQFWVRLAQTAFLFIVLLALYTTAFNARFKSIVVRGSGISFVSVTAISSQVRIPCTYPLANY